MLLPVLAMGAEVSKPRSRASKAFQKLVKLEAPPAQKPLNRLVYTVNFSALSWQDEMRFTGEGVDLEGITTQITACIGAGMTYAFSNFEAVGNSCFFVGQGEAGLVSSSSGYGYQIKTATVYGIRMSPAMYWYPSPAKHLASVGLVLPLILRTGNWPNPGNGFEYGPRVKIFPAFMVAGRFELERLMLTAESGFFHSWKSFQWNIGMAYRFGY
jgi:hypothetical protein